VKVDTLETLKLTVIGSIQLISVGMAVVISHYNDKTRIPGHLQYNDQTDALIPENNVLIRLAAKGYMTTAIPTEIN
jgi:hypothetical protein